MPPVKLRLNTGATPQAAPSASPVPTATATPTTPSIRFNLGRKLSGASQSAAPAKPTKAETKKRARAQDDDGNETTSTTKKKAKLPVLPTGKGSGHKKSKSVLRFNTGVASEPSPKTPQSATHTRLKIKGKGKPPPRPYGVGYDSEAEDAEEDPAIEENIVLRMQPGPDCDYLRNAIETRTVGLPPAQGGADVYMRFYKHRRATIAIRGNFYAAILVDLPCIVESMKSWDKRGWWKSADICQMLYVYEKVDSEPAAEKAVLPSWIDSKTWLWPHGLTPPMHNVRKRRFRKRVSYRTIEAAEDEVQRLLSNDASTRASGGASEADIVDLDRMQDEDGDSGDEDEEMDADGEAEYDEEDDEEEEDAEAMAQRMALELGGGLDDEMPAAEAATPASTAGNVAMDTSSVAPTPAAQDTPVMTNGAADSASDEDEDDGDEDEEDDEEDEQEREKAQMLAQQREEITHLQGQIAQTRADIAAMTNPLIQQRMQRRIETLEKELANKRRAIGELDDEDA